MKFLKIESELNNKPVNLDNEKLVDELFEVEDFLILLSKNLLNNISPEMAMKLAVKQFNGCLKPILQKTIEKIYTSNICLKDAVEEIISFLHNPQSKQLLHYLMGIIDYDAKRRAQTVIKTLYRLKENQQLYYKRKRILKAQEFKIKFLVNIMSIVLGMICSLSPWFSIASILLELGNIMNPFNIQIKLQPAPYVLITFLFISIFNAYILYSSVKIDNKTIFTLIAPLLFLTAYISGNILLSAIL
ncbi:MAG: hypothetical protein OdinLCB4_003290 [Candidatus Odinarchaeum yellowstonii]|uniref:Uncharacterized protein n=1 Tax=Odinarchaeota yellowstonii (strain LCB_4) TaxID=1841599 RepID=A0AAF0IC23_ODILC|nr:MAG: hypothetical protein OdinLCB4_003290 [Candidatus Odinarchaeum yellowstonii]